MSKTPNQKISLALKIQIPTAVLCSALLAQPAIAQAEPSESSDQAATTTDEILEEVIVTGIRSSLESAAQIKRDADQEVDVITAEDIGLFSDNNIAEALQRVPGVQVERDAGEGFRISIRGLGPRFVRTTVNGRTALSAAGGEDGNSEDSRGFTLNMMPSEVVTQVTVEKSTMAKNIEGGLGGTVDLQTVRPLDFADSKDQDLYFSSAFRVGHNDLVGDESYRGSLFLNSRVTDNFGAFFGVVLDDTDRVDHAIETEALRVRRPSDSSTSRFDFEDLLPGVVVNGQVYDQQAIDELAAMGLGVGPDGEDAGVAMLNAARNSSREYDRGRQTYTTGLQWESGRFNVNFDWTYGHEKNDQYLRRFAMSPGNTVRLEEDTVRSLTIDFADQDFSRTAPTIGTITAFEFAGAGGDERVIGENRWIPRTQELQVGGLNLNWAGELWNINGDIGYAQQDTERYDNQVDIEWNAGGDLAIFDSMNGSYDTTGPGGYPIASFAGVHPDGTVTPFDPTAIEHFKFRRAWRTLTNESADNISTRLDLDRHLESGGDDGFFDAVMFGVSWNERNGARTRGRFRQDTTSNDLIDINRDDPLDNSYMTDLIQDYRTDVPVAIHDFVFLSHDDPVFAPMWAVPDSAIVDEPNQGYDVTEEITAAYTQLPFSIYGRIPFRGNFGVRYVYTDQLGKGYAEVLDEWEPRVTHRTYDDVLPSFNIAFDLSPTTVMRFAANRSLTRPDPIDMTAYVSLGDFEDGEDDIGSGSGGNPDLEPYLADNYDASFEWYPDLGGSYAIGFFYKKLDGWIASGRTEEVFTVPVLDADGNVIAIRDETYSIRRKVNTDGGTIKGAELAFHVPFDSFSNGLLGNFGVNGSVTYVDAKIDAVVPDNNLPISLRGTSEWSGNLVAYFEKGKFSTRVAANYRDDYLFQEAEDDYRHDEWTKGSTHIDVNVSYSFTESMLLRLSANNLTGETRERYWETVGPNRFSDDRDYGQYYTMEFRFTTK